MDETMTQLTKCLKCNILRMRSVSCNGMGQSRSVVLGWGIATVPLTCINCLGTGYVCVPVKPKEPIRK